MRFWALLVFMTLFCWNGIFLGNSIAAPTIDSVSPTTAAVGQEITIYGQQFGSSQGAGTVTFYDGVAAGQIVSWSDTEIVCNVPVSAQSGCLTVTTTDGTSNCMNVTILDLGEFHTLSGILSGIPDIAWSWTNIRITAVETSGANLGNEVTLTGNGDYQMALFPGTYDVRFNIGLIDWQTQTEFSVNNYIIARDVVVNADTNLDLAIPIHELSGRVVDEGYTSIPGVRVGISPWTYTYSQDEPGSEGDYILYLLPGTYDLTVSPPAGSRFAATTVNVSIVGNSQLDIVLEEQLLLSGILSGIPEVAWSWSSIRITAVETSGANLGNEITVPGNGDYQMALFPGTYDVQFNIGLIDWQTQTEFSVNNYIIARDVVVNADTNLDLAIPIHELSGRVVDEGYTSIPGVRVGISPWTYTYSQDQPGSEGDYALYLLPGTYKLTVTAPPDLFPPFEIQQLHIRLRQFRDIILSTDYSVLTEAIAALDPELALHYDHFDVIDQSQSLTYEIPVSGSKAEMELIVNWGGSEIRAEVFDPAGNVYADVQSQTPPITVSISNPTAGIWTCRVTAIDVPYENYPIAVVAGITPNLEPFADANGPYFASVGEAVILDATASNDPDGTIVQYEWDLNDDWNFDIRTIQPTFAHTWQAPYSGFVILRVTDNEGATDIDYANVEIVSAGCLGDFDLDRDVDGKDLAAYILDNRGVELGAFAANFGTVNCH